MSKARRSVKSEDPLMALEKASPDLLSLETVLRETASRTGNEQEEPFRSSVYHAVHRMAWRSDDWKMPQSRKVHECGKCCAPILEGEDYVRLQTGVAFDSYDKLCITCAARYLLEVCEVHRFSAPEIGYGFATHWSKTKMEWVRLEADGRTCYRWQPPSQIPDNIKEQLNAAITQTIEKIESSSVPGYDPQQHIPWLASLLNAALPNSKFENEEQTWAVELAIFFAQNDGISRWKGIAVGRDFAGRVHCLGCGQDVTHRSIFNLYGEEDDYLCLHCAATTILTERTLWTIDHQTSDPYFWCLQWHGISQRELENLLWKEHHHKEMAREYQAKIDQGMSIDEIALQENRKPSTIRQKLKELGVTLPQRPKKG